MSLIIFLCVLLEARNTKQPSPDITFVSMFVVNLDPENNQNIFKYFHQQ